MLKIDFTLQIIIFAAISALFIAVLSWASININSQFYLKTICRNKSNVNKIAITFDDGPDPDKTTKILDILNDYNAKASFFIIGEKAKSRPELVRQISDSGHLIANHSYSHSFVFPVMSAKKIQREIKETQDIIEDISGKNCIYFRPPFGVTNPLIARAVKKLKLTTIGWSIRSFDTTGKSSEKIFYRIRKRINGGDIVLLHDTGDNTLEVLKLLLEFLNKKQIKAVRVDELIDE
ncbi:MAG: polysaccharide deacetylase family protein [Bacteroidota bacterium]